MPRPARRIISGMGELHLEIIVDRMLREFKVDANVGKPQVAYRETIRKKVEAEGKYIRQTGGRGQYGHVLCGSSPHDRVKGLNSSTRSGRVIPKEYHQPIEQGIAKRWSRGVLAGYPVIGRSR